MGLNFTADEIFALAEQIEMNGAKFYRTAASGASDEDIHKLLTGLAEMEDDHKHVFQEMRMELTPGERVSTVFDPEGQTDSYLRAMASDHVFAIDQDPSASLSGKESTEEILKTAIRLEKDSILFYLGMKAAVAKGSGKGRLDDIIEQEFSHIATLSDVLGSMKP